MTFTICSLNRPITPGLLTWGSGSVAGGLYSRQPPLQSYFWVGAQSPSPFLWLPKFLRVSQLSQAQDGTRVWHSRRVSAQTSGFCDILPLAPLHFPQLLLQRVLPTLPSLSLSPCGPSAVDLPLPFWLTLSWNLLLALQALSGHYSSRFFQAPSEPPGPSWRLHTAPERGQTNSLRAVSLWYDPNVCLIPSLCHLFSSGGNEEAVTRRLLGSHKIQGKKKVVDGTKQ